MDVSTALLLWLSFLLMAAGMLRFGGEMVWRLSDVDPNLGRLAQGVLLIGAGVLSLLVAIFWSRLG